MAVVWLVKAAGVLGTVHRKASLHDGNSIVVKNGWNVFGRELVGGIGDQKTGLSNGTIADDDTPG